MEHSVNTRPLLQKSDDSESDDASESQQFEDADDEAVVFSKTDDENPVLKVGDSRDRYNLAYIIFYILGMTILLPWNFFITADQYWMFKFREVPHNTTVTEGRTTLQAEFASYLSVAANIPSTLMLIANTFLSHRVPLKVRMIGSLIIILSFFIATTSLVKVDTDPWQQTFFILTLATVAIVNISTAVLQAGLFGIVGCFPHHYITALMSGQALGGVFAALANIVSIMFGASPESSALAYFLIADVMLAIALACYVALSSSPFFKFYMLGKSKHGHGPYSAVPVEETEAHRNVSFQDILKKIWLHCFSIWMLFVVTLAVFPALTVLINSVNAGNKKPWNDTYFVPVIGYLLMNTGDYIGRLIAGYVRRPRSHRWVLALISVIRIVFIPLFMFCNAQPRKNLPILFDDDIWYILVLILFSVSNGYLANVVFINMSSLLSSREQEMAGAIMTCFLGIGASCGSVLSLLVVRLL